MRIFLVKIDNGCYVALDAHDNTPPLRTNHRMLYPSSMLVYFLRYPLNVSSAPARSASSIRCKSLRRTASYKREAPELLWRYERSTKATLGDSRS